MKRWIKNYLLRHLLGVIIVENVITVDKKKNMVFVGGKPISSDDIRQLQAEIKALEGFKIWGIMTNSLKHIAQDKIFNKSLNFEDVMAGKLMLFNLDTQESIAKVVKNIVAK